MPFITPERRAEIAKKGPSACKEVGDLCYVFYAEIMRLWRQSPRWATVDVIYRSVRSNMDKQYELEDKTLFGASTIERAKDLAWQVFFQLYVMPYELKKRDENGDVL